jgi:hypothetical protein
MESGQQGVFVFFSERSLSMKMSALMLPVCAALILAGCADGPRHHVGGPDMPPPGQPSRTPPANRPAADRFSCENGLSVYIRNLDNDRIELALDDKRAILTRAVSGSGVRYVSSSGLFGKGAEWHAKANEGFFGFVDPYGNRVETSCRLATR